MNELVHILPHVNASLNSLATLLLVAAYVQIKRRQEWAHKWTMLAAFGVSVAFLTCYLLYHWLKAGVSTPFPQYPPDWVRYGYYVVLFTHIVLAALVPFLALISIYLGLRDRRHRHRKLSNFTLPIWLYVSITGVVVYLMLYQFYPPRGEADTIGAVEQAVQPASE